MPAIATRAREGRQAPSATRIKLHLSLEESVHEAVASLKGGGTLLDVCRALPAMKPYRVRRALRHLVSYGEVNRCFIAFGRRERWAKGYFVGPVWTR